MPKVLNHRESETIPPGAVYVGRPSQWGNPFKIGPKGTRSLIIKDYRDWLWHPGNEALRQRVRAELRGKDLVCWCAPKPCHADVLLEMANA